MGVGRRMKKQGPPPALDESKISSLKRRKPSDLDDATIHEGKKRRTENKKNARPSNSLDRNGVKPKKPAVRDTGRKVPNTRPKTLVQLEKVDTSDSSAEGMLGDEFENLDDVSDLEGDEVSGSGYSGSDGGLDSAFDSEEDHPREAMFSEDEDISDAEEKLTAANIEGLSRKLDIETEATEHHAQLELKESAIRTNIAGDSVDVFGTDDQGQKQIGLAPDLQLLRSRITETIRILGDLSTLGQPGKSRTDYTNLLLSDICTYYGYTPYLAEKLFNLFTPREAFAFFEANESPRPVVIRTNTLRTNRRSLAQALINRGVVLEPVGKWSKVGLQVFESAVPLGATPEYLAGHYILQAASSFLPVMALAPQPNERILDMAAAPGGKTTYISALMQNTGCVLANDASKPRAKGLIGNIHRLGCKNTIVSNLDAREAFPKILGGFDRILLDAPCSGTGVISKDPSVKTSKTERDFLALPHMQKQLLLAAIDSTDHASKTGGYIVYSTCSVTVEENEGVVQYALRKRPNVKIVDTGLGNFGSPGFKSYMGKKFDDKMPLTRRYFPHRENVDGFYVCKLKKTGPSPTANKSAEKSKANGSKREIDEEEEMVDRAPIIDEEKEKRIDNEAFGPFEEEEDATYIARAERNKLRRKGLNPRAVLKGKPKNTKESKRDNKEK
ncbi:ribosomal RNA methyltransferase Nop2 [Blastomyces parvus]|uniref:Nucleolar protein 2 n=1 Tax=Blastomyces parvus TaxID=2060905 RepID=A0A2B7WQY9_9EURO|nr:ribosomal RNA methyltransferase Nop2 [Blastomyces parvus]